MQQYPYPYVHTGRPSLATFVQACVATDSLQDGVGRATRRVTPPFAVRPSNRVHVVVLSDVRPFQNIHF